MMWVDCGLHFLWIAVFLVASRLQFHPQHCGLDCALVGTQGMWNSPCGSITYLGPIGCRVTVHTVSNSFRPSPGRRCFEVKCTSGTFKDGYGSVIDRPISRCRDPEASVVVRITDTCPCNFPANP